MTRPAPALTPISMKAPWADDPILADGGACGALLRAHDWTTSPLGVPSEWPQELRVLVSVMLGSMQPGVVVWGGEGIALYNDGYAAMAGDQHPANFARPFRQMWEKRWAEVENALIAACAGSGSRLDEFTFERWEAGSTTSATYAFALTPVRTPQGDVMGVFCACVETTWQFLARRDAASETARLKAMFEHAPGAIAVLSGPNHVYELVNRAYMRLIGRNDLAYHGVAEALPSPLATTFGALLDRVYASGEPYVGDNMDVELPPLGPGEKPRHVTLDFVLQPIRDDSGRVSGIFAEVQDVTKRAIAEKQQELLNREIAHRMKNQLAVVNGIVAQSLRAATDISEVRKVIGERIGALARAQTALVEKQAASSTVADVVGTFLEVHASREMQITATGPMLQIDPKPALSLALILHELGTNAAKYGALSTREGRISITWAEDRTGPQPMFVLTWTETGGPSVTAPARMSAGTRLIRAGLAGTRDCHVALEYAPTGLTCRVTADLASLNSGDDAATPP